MSGKGEYVPCLLCDPEMRGEPPLEFINGGGHLTVHSATEPKKLDEYKDWVAEEYELDLDHEVFQNPRALTGKNRFWEYAHLFK